MGGGAHPAPRRPPGSPGTSHTVGPVGVAPWACAYQWLLAGLSQTPAAATRAPDQSHCVFTMEQLEPEPPWVQPSWPRWLRRQPARRHPRLPSSAHRVLAPAEAHSGRQAVSTYTCMGGYLCAWNRGASVHVSHDDDSQVLRRALFLFSLPFVFAPWEEAVYNGILLRSWVGMQKLRIHRDVLEPGS